MTPQVPRIAPGLVFALALWGHLAGFGGLGGAAVLAAQDVHSDLTPPPSTGRSLSSTSGLGPGSPAGVPTITDVAPSIEAAASLSDPHLHYPVPAGPAADEGDDPQDGEEPWSGPAVELGYTHFQLPDGFTGGSVNAGSFGGYLPTGPIRVGARAEIGTRGYSLGSDDAVVRGAILGGYQYLGWLPFAPYAAATVSVGVVFGQRFSTPEAWAFGGGGIEVGADLVMVRNLWIGLSFGYERVSMAGFGFDLWVFRLRLGL
ncbi:MAG: hypothetical protein DRJ42_00675 [Deltaproteobacteria bacterium]|nr:MAG: hypothetical protein DRJ42_00675 [Deltaproteobacteria bacterium]